jgi:hypothetical protein
VFARAQQLYAAGNEAPAAEGAFDHRRSRRPRRSPAGAAEARGSSYVTTQAKAATASRSTTCRDLHKNRRSRRRRRR